MNKHTIVNIKHFITRLALDIKDFAYLLYVYLKRKILKCFYFFESNKNNLVKFMLMKRGRYNRSFSHLVAIFVLAAGVIIAPFLADTYPIFSSGSNSLKIAASETKNSINIEQNVFQTEVSQKPRSSTITYRVEKGDTLSTISVKFGISVETIKWANNLKLDDLTVGDELKILPVTGISHKVAKGESVYTIAKKYGSNPQGIVDFPFNEFANPETFSLVEGQIIIVPDGVMPTEKPVYRREMYIAQGPVVISSAGFTWPLRGGISQFASWYHMALDITSPIGTPIVAAQNGKVVKINVGSWDSGYGTNIIIDNGTGFQSLYSHMSGVDVNLGQDVEAGKTIIGWVGVTGRTTGPHLHFEIRRGGELVNPLTYLQ